MSVLVSSVYIKNAQSRADDWPTRARTIAVEALASGADTLIFTELYDAQRPRLSGLLGGTYVRYGVNLGKVLYHRIGVFKPVSGSVQKFNLGNGKNAVGVHAKHRVGKTIAPISVHLSSAHADGDKRVAEVRSLIAQAKATGLSKHRLVIGGDFNESLEPTATRPVDRAGDALADLGYHDAFTDVAQPVNAEYNSAGAYTPQQHGVHLDRLFIGRTVTATSWRLLYTDNPGSDHFGILIAFGFEY